MSEPPEQPAWSALTGDLWRKIVQAAVLPEHRLDAGSWTQFCKLVGTAACVCKSLRDALLGPDAGVLWEVMSLQSTYPGLSQQASWRLNLMAARQARHAWMVMLHGGGWRSEDLFQVALALTSPLLRLVVTNVHDEGEAGALSEPLYEMSPILLSFTGTQPFVLPFSHNLRHLHLVGCHALERKADGSVDQSTSRRLFECLGDAARLESLHLGLSQWQLTPQAAAQLAAHSRLRQLRIALSVWHDLGQHTVNSLPSVPQLDLRLLVFDSSITTLLPRLQGLQLSSLSLVELDRVTAYRLTAQDAQHLARCSISKQLAVSLVDPTRRLDLPPRLNVVYDQESAAYRWPFDYDL